MNTVSTNIVMPGNAPAAAIERFDLFGVSIDNLTMQQAVSEICRRSMGSEKHRYAFVNADCLNHANRNPAYARVLSRQSRVFADGSGVALAARLNGVRVADNINGTDMTLRCYCTDDQEESSDDEPINDSFCGDRPHWRFLTCVEIQHTVEMGVAE